MAGIQRRAPSAVIGVTDDLTAFQLDAACVLVTRQKDNERDFNRLKFYKQQFKSALSEWWNGEPDSLAEVGTDAADRLDPDDPDVW